MITVTMHMVKSNEPESVQRGRLETLPLDDEGPRAIGLRRVGPPTIAFPPSGIVEMVLTLEEEPMFIQSFPTPALRIQAAESLYPSEVSLKANTVVLSTVTRLA
jgi:hypothetical protein